MSILLFTRLRPTPDTPRVGIPRNGMLFGGGNPMVANAEANPCSPTAYGDCTNCQISRKRVMRLELTTFTLAT